MAFLVFHLRIITIPLNYTESLKLIHPKKQYLATHHYATAVSVLCPLNAQASYLKTIPKISCCPQTCFDNFSFLIDWLHLTTIQLTRHD